MRRVAVLALLLGLSSVTLGAPRRKLEELVALPAIDPTQVVAVGVSTSGDWCAEQNLFFAYSLTEDRTAYGKLPRSFSIRTDHPGAIDDGDGHVISPLTTTLAGLDKPVEIAIHAGPRALSTPIRAVPSVECHRRLVAQGRVGSYGFDGTSAAKARVAGTGGDGGTGGNGGAIVAEAAYVTGAGYPRLLVVAALIDGREQLAVVNASHDFIVELDAAGGLGGEGGMGGKGGCGGDGGRGGNGGHGGTITLRLADARTIVHLGTFVEGGRAGGGGAPGAAAHPCAHAPAMGRGGATPGRDGTLRVDVVPAASMSMLQKALATNRTLRLL